MSKNSTLTKGTLAQIVKERIALGVETPELPERVDIPSMKIKSLGLDCELSSTEIDNSLWGTTEDNELVDPYWIKEFCRENEGESGEDIRGIHFNRWSVTLKQRVIENALLDECTPLQRAQIAWEDFSLAKYSLHRNGYLVLD